MELRMEHFNDKPPADQLTFNIFNDSEGFAFNIYSTPA